MIEKEVGWDPVRSYEFVLITLGSLYYQIHFLNFNFWLGQLVL